MKTKTPKFRVFNATDGIYADPRKMTQAQADSFIVKFRARFAAQGYYFDSRQRRIPIADVKLTLEPV